MADTQNSNIATDTSNSNIMPNDTHGILPDRVYDILKWVAIIVMPALSTFIVGLGGIWSFPYAEQIAATVTAVGVLLGALLGLSSAKYNSR